VNIEASCGLDTSQASLFNKHLFGKQRYWNKKALDDLIQLGKGISLVFSNTGEQTKVVPCACADLLWTLTGDAAIWIESKEPNNSTYHLHHLRGNKNCLAIEYIDKDWFYLSKEKGKYYIGPLSQITTLSTLGLGTYWTPSPNALPIPKSSTEVLSKSENSRE